MPPAIDVLIYAELEPETVRGVRAGHAIEAAAPRGVLAARALLEFVAVIRRRRPESVATPKWTFGPRCLRWRR